MSLNRLIKVPAERNITYSPNDNLVDITLSGSSKQAYNLKNSYLIMNLEPDGNGTYNNMQANAGDPVGSFKLGNPTTAEEYLPSVLVKNCRLESSNKGELEPNNMRNRYLATMSKYMNDDQLLNLKRRQGYGKDTSMYGFPYLPFINQVKSGNVLSTQGAHNVMIPMSDIFELGSYEALSCARLGDLKVHLELEDQKPLLTDALALPDLPADDLIPCDDVAANEALVFTELFWDSASSPVQKGQRVLLHYTTPPVVGPPAVPGYAVRIIANIADVNFAIANGELTVTIDAQAPLQVSDLAHPLPTGATNVRVLPIEVDKYNQKPLIEFVSPGVDTKVLTTTDTFASYDECPLYVGMPIGVKYTPVNANAVAGNTVFRKSRITSIALPQGNAFPSRLNITVDGDGDIPANCNSPHAVAFAAQTYPSWKVNKVDLMLALEEADPALANAPIIYNKMYLESYNRPVASSLEKVWLLRQGCSKVLFLNEKQAAGSDLVSRNNLANYRMFWDNSPNTDMSIAIPSLFYYDRIMRAWGAEINALPTDNERVIVTDNVPKENCQQLMLKETSTGAFTADLIHFFQFVPTVV